MNTVPKDDKEVQVRDGVSPKALLRERGGKYDGRGILPDLPDYLGYLIALVLLWLVYTGYSSVVGVIKDPDSTVYRVSSRVGSHLKDVGITRDTQESHSLKDVSPQDVLTDGKSPVASPKKSWIKKWMSLKRINVAINNAIEYTAGSLDNFVSEQDFDSVESDEEVVSDTEKDDEADSLVYFR